MDNFVLDHSIIARTHAQYIAKQIAEEGKLSNHTFSAEVYDQLIKHRPLVNIAYSRPNQKEEMPKGLAEREVYVLQWRAS